MKNATENATEKAIKVLAEKITDQVKAKQQELDAAKQVTAIMALVDSKAGITSGERFWSGAIAAAFAGAMVAKQQELDAANTTIAALQARIDTLTLEYCPEEMTPEQIEKWGEHQKPNAE